MLFCLSCLLSIAAPPLAFALSANLFSVKQLLQASSGIFRDSLFGSQAVNFIIGGVAVLSAIRGIVSKRLRLYGYFNRASLVTAGIFLWALASCAWSLAPTQALTSLASGAPATLLGIVILPLLVSNIVQISRVVPIWLLLTTCVAGLILVSPEFVMRDGRLVLDLGVAGLKTTRTNPLELGTAAGVCILFGMLYRSERYALATNVLRIFAILVGTTLAIRSGSRGQFLLAILSGVLCYPIASPVVDLRRTIAGLFSLGVLLLLILLLAQRLRMSGSFMEEQRWDASGFESGTEGRLYNISLLMSEYARSPAKWLTGLGYLSFYQLDPEEEYTHCLTADMLGELGLIGAALYGYLLFHSIRLTKQIFSRVSAVPNERNAIGCLVGVTLYMFLLSNKQGNLSGAFLLFSLLLMIARVHKSMHLADDEWADTDDIPLSMSATDNSD